MRIAFFLNAFPLPSETFILNQMTGLIDRGHEVDIYAFKRGDLSNVHADVHRYRLLERVRYMHKLPENYFLRLVKAVGLLARNPKLLMRRNLWNSVNFVSHGVQAISLRLLYAVLSLGGTISYDIVHCQFGTLGLAALPMVRAGILSGKLVTSFRGYDLQKANTDHLYDELFIEGDLFLPVSASFKRLLVESGCDESKITVHRSGIDCSRFSYISKSLISGEPARVMTVARLVEKKGIDIAIRAVARVIASGRRVIYDIVGDGALRFKLNSLVEDLGVGACVRLLGWKSQEEVIDLFERAHLFILPSVTAANGDGEGIPNTVKEAMARGMPVLSTYHSGIPELVEDGVSGFLVPERDADALAERLSYLIDHPEIWPAMGLAGRRRIEKEYDINMLNDRLVEIYRAIA